MRTYPQDYIPLNLIENTPIEYPLCKNIEEASLYLDLLLDPEFIYGNQLNYDLIDYEKLIYIEINFSQNNQDILTKLQAIKENINMNYILKNNYIARLKHNIPNLQKEQRQNHAAEIHLPPKWLRGLE